MLLFIFNSILLNGVLIFLILWLLVSIIVYQRNATWMISFKQWLIFPAFMIFGEQKSATKGRAKSSAEIERFNAYFDESAVLQQLQVALKKRAGIDLEQLELLKSTLQRLSDNYQHQSHYVTELSRKVSASSPATSYQDAPMPYTPPDLPNTDGASLTMKDVEERVAEFHVVLKQIQKDTNQKITRLQEQQEGAQGQFEEEVDALSTAISNISTAYDPRTALADLDKKISSLELYVREVQEELTALKNKKSNPPVVVPIDTNKKEITTNQTAKKKNTPLENDAEFTTIQPPIPSTPTLSPIKVIADENFTNHSGKMLFAAAPENEVFIANQLVHKFVPKVTPYAIKISPRHPQLAVYHLVTHPETVDYARLHKTDLIETAMFVMGKGDLTTAQQMTMKAGELELIDGHWEIVKRAVLRFE